MRGLTFFAINSILFFFLCVWWNNDDNWRCDKPWTPKESRRKLNGHEIQWRKMKLERSFDLNEEEIFCGFKRVMNTYSQKNNNKAMREKTKMGRKWMEKMCSFNTMDRLKYYHFLVLPFSIFFLVSESRSQFLKISLFIFTCCFCSTSQFSSSSMMRRIFSFSLYFIFSLFVSLNIYGSDYK